MPKSARKSTNAKRSYRAECPTGTAPSRALRSNFRKADRLAGPVYKFTRTYNLAGNCAVDGTSITQTSGAGYFTFSCATSGPNFGYIQVYPQLNLLPANSDFTLLFDQYRIINAKVKLTPYQTVSAMTDASSFGTSTNGMLVHSCIDYDGAPSLSFGTSDSSCLGAIRQEKTYRMAPFLTTDGKSYTVSCPAPAVRVDNSGVGLVMNSPWLNQTNSAVPHYGLIFVMEMFSSTGIPSQVIYFKGECTLELECRGLI